MQYRITAATMLLAGMVAVPAHAIDRPIITQAHGSGACQAALPNYEGQIRKRPLALQNEGGQLAFVSCSPVSLLGSPLHGIGHGLTLANLTAADITVTCPAVNGPPLGATYMPKSVTVPAAAHATLSWLAADGVDELNMYGTSFSCAIPPGIGVHQVNTRQVVDIGD